MNIPLISKLAVLTSLIIFCIPHLCFSGGASGMETAIVGSWKLLKAVTPKTEIIPIENETYEVAFTDEGKVHMKLEANIVNGNYEATAKNIKLKQPLMMTMAAWRPDSPAPKFISLMENAAGYFFKDGKLYIDTFADGGTLHFEKLD